MQKSRKVIQNMMNSSRRRKCNCFHWTLHCKISDWPKRHLGLEFPFYVSKGNEKDCSQKVCLRWEKNVSFKVIDIYELNPNPQYWIFDVYPKITLHLPAYTILKSHTRNTSVDRSNFLIYLPTIAICTTDSQDIIFNTRGNTQMIQNNLHPVNNMSCRWDDVHEPAEVKQIDRLSGCDFGSRTVFPIVAVEQVEWHRHPLTNIVMNIDHYYSLAILEFERGNSGSSESIHLSVLLAPALQTLTSMPSRARVHDIDVDREYSNSSLS